MTQQMQMIERREKLTLNWRPRGQPARRVDDFAEIPHLAIAPVPAAVEPERKEIGARLENWARWNIAGTRTIGTSPTAVFCERLRKDALGEDPGHGERRAVDESDALRLELAMRGLDTRTRMILWWCYIQQAQPEVVCRKMGIAHKPATEFVSQFRQAQAAVEKLLDTKRAQP
jgi:DNA-directed RNA polymerase specialized sigma24 family protein